MDYIEFVGFFAAMLTTAAFLPQVYKTWKTKDVSGLSLPMYIVFSVGVFGWLVYGVLKESPSIILANAVTLVSSFLLLYYKIRYR